MQRTTRLLLLAVAVLNGLFLLLAANMLASPVNASADRIWRDTDERSIALVGRRLIIPNRYRTVQADLTALRSALAAAPSEGTSAAAQAPVTLPLPDGTFQRFRITTTPLMAPGLAAQFPEIATYTGQGIDDRTATVRLDLTPQGFHGLILSAGTSVYIDPYSQGDTSNYISYYKADFQPPAGKTFNEGPIAGEATTRNAAPPSASTGASLRTYRAAVAATGEYTTFQGGTVVLGQAAIVTTMNRVVGVYEKEVAIRMQLVANNSSLVYTNSATDPYTNSDPSALLSENQANLDTLIGSSNYDIGHVFSTGGGGLAGLGVVCQGGAKAEGETGSDAPTGDPFDIDYVAHEIGHQFGGNHTFNGTTVNCGGGNREASVAYEPGSGTTIMAYAGICGAEDLQAHSDPYFHTGSFDEIVAYTTAGGGGTACGTLTSTGNTPPISNAGADHVIPANTPFTLTGSGSDGDNDTLTYDWEQFDLGTAAPPNTDDGSRPIFRVFNPVSTGSRTFPKLSDILGNTSTLGESLPTTNRTMHFRLVVRDNRSGGGGVAYDTANVQVSAAAGPFAVTAPNTAVTWTGGGQQTVTWNVASTTAAPVNCPNVDILLSTDGGSTFATSLASATANDGTQVITVPNVASITARVKVACANNIFFDISNTNFTTTVGSPPTPTDTATATSTATAAGTATASNTPTATGSATATGTPTGTSAATSTPTSTTAATATATSTATATRTATGEPTTGDKKNYLPIIVK